MNMKQRLLGIASLALSLVIGAQSASAVVTGTGTVAVTATTVASVSLTFATDGAGIELGGTGTSAATIAFGNVQAFGNSATTGITYIPSDGVNYGVSTVFDVVVTVANQESANYALTAALANADAANTWEVAGVALTTTQASLNAAGTYVTPNPYTLRLLIPLTATPGSITNTINFIATPN